MESSFDRIIANKRLTPSARERAENSGRTIQSTHQGGPGEVISSRKKKNKGDKREMGYLRGQSRGQHVYELTESWKKAII